MRLTINLDEDLHRMAKALATAEDCSISAAVNQLLRRINGATSGGRPLRRGSKTGLPLVECKRAIKDEDVYRAEEHETLRHLAS